MHQLISVGRNKMKEEKKKQILRLSDTHLAALNCSKLFQRPSSDLCVHQAHTCAQTCR